MADLPDFPPTVHHSALSHSITHSAASAFLETYLSLSESHPHLHPDALITPTGVTFSAHGGPMGGVLMHNLRRVVAGLKGEFLEPEKTPEPEEEPEKQGGKKRKGVRTNIETVESVDAAAAAAAAETANEGWVDMAEYEREEGRVEVGEIGERDNFVEAGGEEPAIDIADMDGGDAARKRKLEKKDKEARKMAKKERQKEIRRNKETARAVVTEADEQEAADLGYV